jgi:hypothetical protein
MTEEQVRQYGELAKLAPVEVSEIVQDGKPIFAAHAPSEHGRMFALGFDPAGLKESEIASRVERCVLACRKAWALWKMGISPVAK